MSLLKKIFKKEKVRYKSFTNYNENEPFVIISNNCWGAEIYKDFNKQFNTPFIGLFLYAQDYIKLLENFDHYLSLPLEFSNSSKWINSFNYPLGLLGDVELHFLHYESENEALDKWTRRVSRMKEVSEDNYFFKICDRDNGNIDIIKRFHLLKFKNKISFSIFDFEHSNHIKVIENEKNKSVEDGILLYNVTNKYTDIGYWINNKILKKNDVK